MFEMRDISVQHWRTSVVVVGSGIAGLSCALALAPMPVLLLTKTPLPQSGSSVWAQGGVAAAVGDNDTPESHARDTVTAGAGLVDPDRALLLAREGAKAVHALIADGIPFDRNADGSVALAREAAHACARVVHAGGDATGRNLIEALLEIASRQPSIRIVPECFAVDLVAHAGRITGLLAYRNGEGWVQVHANHIVLATGGIGRLWRETTNPDESTGDGQALAARAGARLADLEFMQLHPTALMPPRRREGERLPLLTEALRGAGALLLDRFGRRFMREEHPQSELAPRDIVARAIARQAADGRPVFLDMRPALAGDGAKSFPQAIATCHQHGLDALKTPVRIAPAAHYHMGGVVTDDRGRTSVEGLWACGEVATTGVHGANRLASNSLLEGIVFGRRVADDIRSSSLQKAPAVEPRRAFAAPPAIAPDALERIRAELRALMADNVGIVRNGQGLQDAADGLCHLERRLAELAASSSKTVEPDYATLVACGEVANMLTLARLVTLAAQLRTESRGAHFRSDHPDTESAWERRLTLTLADLDDVRSSTAGGRC